jgi:SAM-dependent methyltransferase/acyl carrier protein
MVYDCFSEVVEYADYYRGVHNVSAYGCNATGLVKVPSQRPASLNAGICDPIILDNFLQVSGIHCNSLSNRDKSMVLMCTSIDEIIFSPGFFSTESDSREWTVYTRFEENNPKTRINDIFVYDNSSGDMVVTILGANFHAVAFKSLMRTLARLNRTTGITTKIIPEITPTPASSSDIGEINDSGYSSEPVDGETKLQQSEMNITGSLASRLDQISSEASRVSDVLLKVRTMFSQIIEMPVENITPTTTLDALGIDSLLVTEVLADLSSLFGTSISLQQFSECSDVLAVANLVGGINGTIENTSLTGENANESARPNHSPLDGLNLGKLNLESLGGLAKIGQEAEETTNLASIAQTAFAQCSTSYEEHAKTTNFKGFYENVFPMQSELVVVYVLEAFAKLGCDLRQLAPNNILPKFQYQSRHTKVVCQLQQILVDAGLVIVTSDGEYSRSEKSLPASSPTELTKSIIQSFPQHTSEVKLLQKTAHKLAECLTEAENPISFIFQNAEARALLGDVYANAPMFKTGTLQFTEYLNSIVTQSKGGKKLKILELGAGTGGTTKTVVETLAKHGASFTYTLTDLSPSLVAQARRKFSDWPSMEFMVVDIEKQPELKFLSSYDIVLSTNCIHATKDLVATTANIRKMLKPDGLLCLVELTRNLYWFDLVFGLLEGWWLFTDDRKHALATEQRWKQDLSITGFRWIDWSKGLTRDSELLRVITASPTEPSPVDSSEDLTLRQTFPFKEVDGLQLHADIYYPNERIHAGHKLPVGKTS